LTGAGTGKMPALPRKEMAGSAPPTWHRLEACATNLFLSQRSASYPLFLIKQKTNYLMQDAIVKEIAAVVGPAPLSSKFKVQGSKGRPVGSAPTL